MSEFAKGWLLHVDRGPEWLFVVLEESSSPADPTPPVADHVWEVIACHAQYRIVFEVTEGTRLTSHLVGQMVLLHRRLHQAEGVFRICGFSPENYEVLELMRLSGRFHNYPDREAAVMGYRKIDPTGVGV